MPQLTLQEYHELAKKLNSRIWAGRARRKLINYIKTNPQQAINYTLEIVEKENNPQLLELTTTTILQTIVDIPEYILEQYIHKYINTYPRIIETLLKDILVLTENKKLQHILKILGQEINSMNPPSKTHLETVLINHDIKSILKTINIPVVSKVWEKNLMHASGIISWSPDGQYIAGAAAAVFYIINRSGNFVCDRLFLGNIVGGITVPTITLIQSISWSPDGQYIAAGIGENGHGKILIFTRSGDLQWESADLGGAKHGLGVNSVSWSPDGQYIAAGTATNKVFVFSRSRSIIWRKELDSGVNSVSWSPDGQYIAIGAHGKIIVLNRSGEEIWETSDLGNSWKTEKLESVSVNSVSWSPDGQYIAAGIARWRIVDDICNSRVLIFSRSGKKIWESGDLGGYVYSVSWSPDGQYIAVGVGWEEKVGVKETEHGKVYIFDRSGNLLGESGDLDGKVSSVSWSPDGQYIAVGGTFKSIIVFALDMDRRIDCIGLKGIIGYGVECLCKGEWISGLGTYLLLRDSGYDTGILGLGLIGLYTFMDFRLFYNLSEDLKDFYLSVLANYLYSDSRNLGVLEVSPHCHKLLKVLFIFDKALSLGYPDLGRVIENMLNNIPRNDLTGIISNLSSFADKLERITNIELDAVRGCLDQLTSKADIIKDTNYCLDLLAGRVPKIRISLKDAELTMNVWSRVILEVINEERVPIEMINAYFSRGFEVERVEGCRCEAGGECTAVLYVKALEPGVVPCSLVVEGRVVGIDKEFRIEVPLELRVSTPHRPLGRAVGKPLAATVESLPGLPSVESIFSSRLHGLIDYVLGGRSYRVLWRESYTSGWSYGGGMECIKLGCGGWGCSYLCRAGGSEVVLKIPLDYRGFIEEEYGEVPSLNARLLNRIKSMAETLMALEHPGIIRLLGYGVRVPVLVYEYANQGTLAYQLDNGWSPRVEDTLVLGLQLADTLRYIHSRGLVHGDIKPSNIFLRDGIVKVGDFSSLTKLLSRTSRYSRLTTCTPGYCAPEQVYRDLKREAIRRGVENRVDVYQLGNILLELLAGETVDGSEADEADLETTLEPVENNELANLIREMLDPEPWNRPSMEEVEKTLYRIYSKI